MSEQQSFDIINIVNARQSNGVGWEFNIQFSDNTLCWVSDLDCNCETEIKKFFRQNKMNVRTCYVFCRVSTKEQTQENSVSIDAQLQFIMEKIDTSVYDRVKIIKISKSAYKNVPSELIDISDNVNYGDMLAVYRIDRLARNIIKFLNELENMHNKGTDIYSVSDEMFYKDDKLEFIQRIVNAQKESQMISKRVNTSNKYKRDVLKHRIGSLPYGKKYGRNASTGKQEIVNNLDEIKTIKFIHKQKGYHQDIANLLNYDGNKKRGRIWSAAMVQNIKNQFDRNGNRFSDVANDFNNMDISADSE